MDGNTMKILLIGAIVVAATLLLVINNDAALAMVCSNIDYIQNQYPLECSKARVISAF
jgi:hypothetical protein